MDDEIDIYGDLIENENLITSSKDSELLEEDSTDWKEVASKLKEDYDILVKEKKVLAKNFSSLYKTAVSEIKRKDQIIAELRKSLDDVVFKRKFNSYTNLNKELESIKSDPEEKLNKNEPQIQSSETTSPSEDNLSPNIPFQDNLDQTVIDTSIIQSSINRTPIIDGSISPNLNKQTPIRTLFSQRMINQQNIHSGEINNPKTKMNISTNSTFQNFPQPNSESYNSKTFIPLINNENEVFKSNKRITKVTVKQNNQITHCKITSPLKEKPIDSPRLYDEEDMKREPQDMNFKSSADFKQRPRTNSFNHKREDDSSYRHKYTNYDRKENYFDRNHNQSHRIYNHRDFNSNELKSRYVQSPLDENYSDKREYHRRSPNRHDYNKEYNRRSYNEPDRVTESNSHNREYRYNDSKDIHYQTRDPRIKKESIREPKSPRFSRHEKHLAEQNVIAKFENDEYNHPILPKSPKNKRNDIHISEESIKSKSGKEVVSEYKKLIPNSPKPIPSRNDKHLIEPSLTNIRQDFKNEKYPIKPSLNPEINSKLIKNKEIHKIPNKEDHLHKLADNSELNCTISSGDKEEKIIFSNELDSIFINIKEKNSRIKVERESNEIIQTHQENNIGRNSKRIKNHKDVIQPKKIRKQEVIETVNKSTENEFIIKKDTLKYNKLKEKTILEKNENLNKDDDGKSNYTLTFIKKSSNNHKIENLIIRKCNTNELENDKMHKDKYEISTNILSNNKMQLYGCCKNENISSSLLKSKLIEINSCDSTQNVLLANSEISEKVTEDINNKMNKVMSKNSSDSNKKSDEMNKDISTKNHKIDEIFKLNKNNNSNKIGKEIQIAKLLNEKMEKINKTNEISKENKSFLNEENNKLIGNKSLNKSETQDFLKINESENKLSKKDVSSNSVEKKISTISTNSNKNKLNQEISPKIVVNKEENKLKKNKSNKKEEDNLKEKKYLQTGKKTEASLNEQIQDEDQKKKNKLNSPKISNSGQRNMNLETPSNIKEEEISNLNKEKEIFTKAQKTSIKNEKTLDISYKISPSIAEISKREQMPLKRKHSKIIEDDNESYKTLSDSEKKIIQSKKPKLNLSEIEIKSGKEMVSDDKKLLPNTPKYAKNEEDLIEPSSNSNIPEIEDASMESSKTDLEEKIKKRKSIRTNSSIHSYQDKEVILHVVTSTEEESINNNDLNKKDNSDNESENKTKSNIHKSNQETMLKKSPNAHSPLEMSSKSYTNILNNKEIIFQPELYSHLSNENDTITFVICSNLEEIKVAHEETVNTTEEDKRLDLDNNVSCDVPEISKNVELIKKEIKDEAKEKLNEVIKKDDSVNKILNREESIKLNEAPKEEIIKEDASEKRINKEECIKEETTCKEEIKNGIGSKKILNREIINKDTVEKILPQEISKEEKKLDEPWLSKKRKIIAQGNKIKIEYKSEMDQNQEKLIDQQKKTFSLSNIEINKKMYEDKSIPIENNSNQNNESQILNDHRLNKTSVLDNNSLNPIMSTPTKGESTSNEQPKSVLNPIKNDENINDPSTFLKKTPTSARVIIKRKRRIANLSDS